MWHFASASSHPLGVALSRREPQARSHEDRKCSLRLYPSRHLLAPQAACSCQTVLEVLYEEK